MKRIIEFEEFSVNEAVIMPKNFGKMMDEINSKTSKARHGDITLEEANKIGESYGVKFLNYDEFLEALPENLRHTAPPRGTPFFGFLDKNDTIKIVSGFGRVTFRDLGFINHILEHESVHIGQSERNKSGKCTLPNANDSKAYFSDKNEVMAFSQSIINMIHEMTPIRNLEQLKRALNSNPLWRNIKSAIGNDKEIKNRYLKYIYQYAEKYIDGN